jgi:hypothetical protein
VFLSVVLFSSFALAMKSQDHNENMYVTAAALLDEGSLYEDFAYLQTPLQPYLYNLWFKLTGEGNYLLKAKIANWLAWVVCLLCVYYCASILSEDLTFSLISAALFSVSDLTVRLTFEASNYTFSMMFSLLSVAFLLAYMRVRNLSTIPSNRLLFLCGLFIGLSVSTKLYYAAVLAIEFLFFLYLLRSDGRKLIGAESAWLGSGTLLGLFPTLYFALKSTSVFIFNNMTYHTLTALRFAESPIDVPVSLSAKLAWVGLTVANSISTLTLLTLLFLLVVFCWRRSFQGRENTSINAAVFQQQALLLLIGCGLVSMLVALFMTPVWLQYLALPIPFTILIAAALYRQLNIDRRNVIQLVAVLGIGFSFLSTFPGVIVSELTHTGESRRSSWVGFSFADIGEDLGVELRANGVSGKIATMRPLYVLESGYPIHEGFSTGPFLYSVSQELSEDQRKNLHAVSRTSIASDFVEERPAAILVGFYQWDPAVDDFIGEAALEEYARSENANRIDGSFGRLYVLPDLQ